MVVESLPVGRASLVVDDVVADERTYRRRHHVCHQRAARRRYFDLCRQRVPLYRSNNYFDDTPGNQDWKFAVQWHRPCRPYMAAYRKWSSSGF